MEKGRASCHEPAWELNRFSGHLFLKPLCIKRIGMIIKGFEPLSPGIQFANGDTGGYTGWRDLIHCHSYRADEILMLMNVLKDFGIKKICFQHVNEGFKVAPELAAFGLRPRFCRLVGIQI